MATVEQAGHVLEENLAYLGAALAYLVAGIHLFHPDRGFPRLVALLATDNASLLVGDPRPALFVASALAILVGIKLVMLDIRPRLVYALGMALLATFFLGYFAWHFTGHGGFLPGREAVSHQVGPVESLVTHVTTYPLAALSKLVEAALFAVLAILYRDL